MANTKKNQETVEMVTTDELKVEELKPETEEVKPEAEAPVEEVKKTKEADKTEEPKTVKKIDAKMPIVEKMMADAQTKEADKQKLIYSAMTGMVIVRN